jgi:NADPH-dependent 2,4-dienoyl-CoA reductase/sulfur reductase-like enzyme
VKVDVAVVGGGPAGMSAALAAARAGASVALIDEYAAPGGQIWRRRFDDAGGAALPRAARELSRALEASSVTVLSGASVWAVPAPGVLLLTGDQDRVRPGAIVLATGAYDRPVAFPGWTLPGVMTAGGAQALAKGQGVVPGRRVLLAGAGPFLLPVAEQLRACGAEVVAVAEATRRRDWLRAGRRMSAHPARLAEYARYRTRVRRIAWGHVIVRAEGEDRVRTATIAQAGPDWAPTGRERTFEVDAVCTAYGFLPSVDLARALGCELRGDAVAHDEDMRTSVAGVFVAGEAAGVGGADLALVEGELAGHSAASHAVAGGNGAGGVDAPDPAGLQARRAKLAGFAEILADLFEPRPGLTSLAGAGTVLCRCEDVTAGAVDAAVAGGATTMSALKVVTRCGQGPCQGRTCERLVAARLPAPERFSARAPIRPIPLGVLMDAD